MHFVVFCTKPLLYSHAYLAYVFPLSSPSEYLSVLFIHYGSVHCTLLITKAYFVLRNRSIPTLNRKSLQNLYAFVLLDLVDGVWPCGSAADRLWPCFCKCMMGMFPVVSSYPWTNHRKIQCMNNFYTPSVSLLFLVYQVVYFKSIFPFPCWKKTVVVLMIRASWLVASSRWSLP